MEDSLRLLQITKSNLSILKSFLDNAGDSITKFRYFNSRELSVVENHLVSYLLCLGNQPIGYGHLDQEDHKVWLGIAVKSNMKGKGHGKYLMNSLINRAKKEKLREIHLSVDNDNKIAQKLYEKYGFVITQKREDITFYKLIL